MHTQTHILSGWCAANLLRLTGRQRLFCMLAAVLADLDGLSHLYGEMAFAEYHHKLGHNVLFGAVLAGALTAFSNSHRVKSFFVYLSLFHLHLVMDYFGSGRAWTIYYLWPFSNLELRFRYAWAFYSWQNITAAFTLYAWTIWIAVRCGRTPLEVLMPRLDRQLVDWLRNHLTRRPAEQPVAAE